MASGHTGNSKTSKILTALAAACAVAFASGGERPVLQFRLEIEHTLADGAWAKTSGMLKKAPGLCDEIWFGTGFGMPRLETHRRNAANIARAAEEMRSLGWKTALQFQATIGHGGAFCEGKDYSGRGWTGWTNSRGEEDRFCNCPRDPRFLAYMRETAKIYASLHPSSVWIDDDLRIDNHGSISSGSLDGCWCGRCIADFNAATGGGWTRATLERAARKDAKLRLEYERFSIGSVAAVARAIGEEFHAISPETQLAFQHCFDATRTVEAIAEALAAAGGRPAAYRPGGGAYYDDDPNVQIVKALRSSRCRRDFARKELIGFWTSEIACFPRTWATKSAKTITMEAFAALASGMDAASALVLNYGKEDEELYFRTRIKPMAEAAPFLRAYAKSCEGALAAGFASQCGMNELYRFALSGAPVLFGPGREFGKLSKRDVSFNPKTASTAQTQNLRDSLDARAGGTAAVLESPFYGLMIPRTEQDGTLRNTALLALRHDAQGPLRLRLRKTPPGAERAVWREIGRAPVELVLSAPDASGARRVEIPSVGAWNGGYIDFTAGKP